MIMMMERALRRPPGGGHFLFGLRHASTWVLLLVLVVLVVIAVWVGRRR